MLKVILLILLIVIIVFALVVAFQPSYFKYSRSIVINAPAAEIFPEVNNPRKTNAWSPWLQLDPNAKVSYSGTDEGVGATTSWIGNRNIGEGAVTITESRPNEYVQTRLDFLKPMKATNVGEFILVEENGQTTVTWSMSGKANYMGKAMGLIFNCEKMVGEQFQKGLDNLKKLVETR